MDPVVDIVGDSAVVRVIQDHQSGEKQRVLQPMYRKAHQGGAFPLVVQNEGQQCHHQHKDDGAADDGVCNTGVIEKLYLRRDVLLLAGALLRVWTMLLITVVSTIVLAITHKARVYTHSVIAVESSTGAEQGVSGAVLLVAPVRTVLKPIALEAPDDAVDPAGTGEELWATLRFGFRTLFFIAFIKAVGYPIALPASWNTVPTAAHEVPGDVTSCTVATRYQLSFY